MKNLLSGSQAAPVDERIAHDRAGAIADALRGMPETRPEAQKEARRRKAVRRNSLEKRAIDAKTLTDSKLQNRIGAYDALSKIERLDISPKRYVDEMEKAEKSIPKRVSRDVLMRHEGIRGVWNPGDYEPTPVDRAWKLLNDAPDPLGDKIALALAGNNATESARAGLDIVAEGLIEQSFIAQIVQAPTVDMTERENAIGHLQDANLLVDLAGDASLPPGLLNSVQSRLAELTPDITNVKTLRKIMASPAVGEETRAMATANLPPADAAGQPKGGGVDAVLNKQAALGPWKKDFKILDSIAKNSKLPEATRQRAYDMMWPDCPALRESGRFGWFNTSLFNIGLGAKFDRKGHAARGNLEIVVNGFYSDQPDAAKAHLNDAAKHGDPTTRARALIELAVLAGSPAEAKSLLIEAKSPSGVLPSILRGIEKDLRGL